MFFLWGIVISCSYCCDDNSSPFFHPIQVRLFYQIFNSWHINNGLFIKIWCREGMFTIQGEIKNLIDLYYFIMNICTHFSYYCCGVFLLRGISKTFFHHFPTFPVNPCQHVAFDWLIRVAMITLNMSINIIFENFRYCIIIGRILIKINIHWLKNNLNVAFSFGPF